MNRGTRGEGAEGKGIVGMTVIDSNAAGCNSTDIYSVTQLIDNRGSQAGHSAVREIPFVDSVGGRKRIIIPKMAEKII